MGQSKRDHRSLAVSGVVFLLLGAVALKAEPAEEFDLTFEERFSLSQRVTPTFTRPEVVELLSSLRPWASPDEHAASAEIKGDGLGPVGRIVFAEPKGPAKVLKELLDTPVKELLVSRAEAGPDVPPPPAQDVTASTGPAAATPGGASVPARAADPVSERPPAENIAAAPGQSVGQESVASRTGAQNEAQAPHEPSARRDVALAPAATPAKEKASTPDDSGRLSRDVAASAKDEPRDGSRRIGEELPGATKTMRTARRLANGRAAWYEHPGRTASGEKFDPNKLTAAHHSLPLGTRVQVVNTKTGRAVVVRINDRIPRRTKVMIDLSRASAKAIGLAGVGLVALYQLD